MQEKAPQIVSIVGCIVGIFSSLVFLLANLLFIAFTRILSVISLGVMKDLGMPLYMVYENTVLAIIVSIAAAAMSFSKKKIVAAAFLIIFAVLGIILISIFYLLSA
ncbi:MAG: hypothetical protein DRN29_07010, partial [Thermoplasmata archaeon]